MSNLLSFVDLFDLYHPTESTSEEVKRKKLYTFHTAKVKKHLRNREGFFTAKDIQEELFPETPFLVRHLKQTLRYLEDTGFLFYGPDDGDEPTYCTCYYWRKIHV